MSPDTLGPLLPAVPAVLGLIGLVTPRAGRAVGAALGVAGAAVSLLIVSALLADDVARAGFETSREWVTLGSFQVTLGVAIDQRALFVALAVAIVALAVQVYSIGYLKGDERYGPYAAQISIFTAAMLAVVVGGDLILVLVGWEVMGACSYLLIAHDRKLPEAPAAAVKAFLVTRVGDVGFLLGIALLGVNAGSFRIADVLSALPQMTTGTLTAAAILLLAGVAGKSAQFPLHTWLPDAMAGPTPISALIHAATMVAAGVYVVDRLYPVFAAAPASLTVLGVMAVITLLLGAFAATAQDDIKRVLAWSTVSQLGYMTGALAVGARDSAIFHLLTHAAFKALLFLAAGGVIHAVGTNLMSRMGGLRKALPVTFWTMTIGLAALAGIPPMAGFWSKEAILTAAEHGTGGTALAVYLAGLVGTFVTAWYAMRLWLRVFFGPGYNDHVHVPSWVMRVPLLVLAVPAAGLGLGAYAANRELTELDALALLPIVLVVAGLFAAWWGWRRTGDPASVLGRARGFVASAFGLDAVQNALVVAPVRGLARVTRAVDESGVDGVVTGVGAGTLALGGTLTRWHRSGIPRALAGVLMIAAVSVVVFALNGLLR
ncbi:MAG: NADH-quinone oxidoreductase subunit L [Hamadaea sp.]|uniref:NADH-quinone oxidoreductase subunit 5 family protein n=1 Tax=Hamadaea sp. TaxID=2024425 RepID=UPI001828898C|nr:NADH-quinone oxidoreductase subunit L [Hamadaea sp.]NUR70585.1 NADH-quinone oxidoreductase subunit L [Hamadaea sp.]NUT19286.1 NADH-quinone oxidoreductase subunit L [Hamadaea sp.]